MLSHKPWLESLSTNAGDGVGAMFFIDIAVNFLTGIGRALSFLCGPSLTREPNIFQRKYSSSRL